MQWQIGFPCYQVSSKWASSNNSGDYKWCSCSPGYTLVSFAILPSFVFYKKNYQRAEFELIHQIQGCLLSLTNTLTISYGYHIKVILSPKLLHWETIPRVRHLQLLLVFCNMPAFLPESLETPPPPGPTVISYIVLSLQVCNEDSSRLICVHDFSSPFTDFVLYP